MLDHLETLSVIVWRGIMRFLTYILPGTGGFQGPNPAFNQGFFPQNQGVNDGSWNPHGAKRSRQE